MSFAIERDLDCNHVIHVTCFIQWLHFSLSKQSQLLSYLRRFYAAKILCCISQITSNQKTNQDHQILHKTSRPYLNNNWKIHTLYYTYSTYLINYWEGFFFFTSFKYRKDRNIYTCIRLYMLMGIEYNFKFSI